jgi:5'-nucleotidase
VDEAATRSCCHLKETLHIYHTNDLHSHFHQWPKIAYFLSERKKHHEAKKEKMLILDIGDHLDRFHPITEATAGKANVQLLNDLNYDFVTIGNNEGITLPYKDLDTLYENAAFDVLVANLFTLDGDRPKWAKPYIFYDFCGVSICFIGLTIHYNKFYELLGWHVEDPFVTMETLLPQVKEKADCIILLSHLGLNEDERMAERFPEIEVIFGAHTHHLLRYGKLEGNTLLCGAGKHGHYVGYVCLSIDPLHKKIIEKQAYTYSMEDQPKSFKTEKMLEKFAKESEHKLNSLVTVLQEDLHVRWFDESPFAKLLADALREWCKADLAMVNAGVLLESLPKGPVTKRDLHRICPHPINPCKVYLKGDQLKEVILQANTEKMEQLQIKGFGFRGKIMGKMIYSGVEIETERLNDGIHHVKQIFVQGKPLDLEKWYSVATIDMFTFGHLYPEISRAKHKEYYLPEMLRDLLAWKLKQTTTV